MRTLQEYIEQNWDKTVRQTTPELLAESSTLLALPKPYTVPCIDTFFQEMYYWDTYFTNLGLLASGRLELAIHNVTNFMHLIDTYGFIPNGTRTWFLNRSQPPFFGMMVAEIYKQTNDKMFLEGALPRLKKEYLFWDTKRKAPNGLNCYSANATQEECRDILRLYLERTGNLRTGDDMRWGTNVLAEAESGWDFKARFDGRCHEFNAVDLNALLYFDEVFIAFAEKELEAGDGEPWRSLAEKRNALMYRYMRGDDGIFYDYAYEENRRSNVKSAAGFFPYFVGLATDRGPAKVLLESLELPFGVSAAEETEHGNYQWGYKNGWACLQWVVFEGLRNCGLQEDAARIAHKYVNLVETVFENTGKLWEKYNVLDGNAQAVGEYGTPEMLGWTAGVYLALLGK